MTAYYHQLEIDDIQYQNVSDVAKAAGLVY
jgi:hypothetical protein